MSQPVGKFDFLHNDPNITHRALVVFEELAKYTDKDNQCYPAIPTLARDLKLSKSTVKRALDDLEREKYIVKKQRYRESGGKSTLLYTLIFPENSPQKH